MNVDALRDSLFRAITTPRGDAFTPLRVPKDFARRMNLVLGGPLRTREDSAKRRDAAKRLDILRSGGTVDGAPKAAAAPIVAPVVVYFEKDRNARELTRIEELLGAKGFKYDLRDVTGDEAALAFVMREAKCEEDELPIAFVATTVVGGYQALVAADVAGELARLVYGDAR